MYKFHHVWLKRLGLAKAAYQTAKLYYFMQFDRRYKKIDSPIIVYQMGKVGSRTVVETIKKINTGDPVFHLHRLTDKGFEFIEQLGEARGRVYPGENYWLSYYLRIRVGLGEDSRIKQWRIITLTRDPIARNVSAFFFNLPIWYPTFEHDMQIKTMAYILSKLRDIFLYQFPHDIPVTWFDEEFQPIFGLDVFAKSFAHEQGYEIYDIESVRLLILRLEDMNRALQPALASFLQLNSPHFEIVKANLAEKKAYYAVYDAFLRQPDLPVDYLDKMYESDYACHFYTEAERATFYQRWQGARGGIDTVQ